MSKTFVIGNRVKVTNYCSVFYQREGVIVEFVNSNFPNLNQVAAVMFVGDLSECEKYAINIDDLDFVFDSDKEKVKDEEAKISPYHTKPIVKGEYGKLSKIYEEVAELEDAANQENPILILCEISDILGAIDGYLLSQFDMSIEDALKMTKLNAKAFQSGYRTSN